MSVKKTGIEVVTAQNKPESVAILITVRALYQNARRVFYTQGSLAILIALIFPTLSVTFPAWANPLSAIAIIYFFIQILILHTTESRLRENAATYQELFDTNVLGIPWNSILIGRKPNQKLITKYAQRFPAKKLRKLRNWYPTSIESLPNNQVITMCQRVNVWWDARLRYSLSICLAFLSLGLLFFLIIEHQHIESYLPLFELLVQQMIAHYESARRLRHISKRLDALLAEPLRAIPMNTTRTIQDELFHHRQTAQTIPKWLYTVLRPYFETNMNARAKGYVDSALKRV